MKILNSCSLLCFLFLFHTGCQKRDSSGNPCEGLMNQSPPVNINVKFIDKGTKESLILTKNLEAKDFTVTDLNTGKPVSNWMITSHNSSTSPVNGSLQFAIFASAAGKYAYRIELNKLAAVTLNYTSTKKETGDRCKPVAYPVSEIKITDHAFTILSHDGKSYPNVLILEL